MLRYRIFYILTLAAIFLFYLFFAGYLAFFLLAAAILLPLASWVVTLLAIRKTTFRVQVKNAYANKAEEIRLMIRAENRSLFPIARAELKICCENSLCGEKRYETFSLPVSSGPEQTVEFQMKSQFCGKVSVRLTQIKYFDSLGIFTAKHILQLYTEVFVAPTVHFLDARIDTAANPGVESSTYSKVKPGDDPSEIFDVRPFRDGDRLRSIHWKLSSKLDELMVKEFSLPTDSSVLLLTELMAADMAALDTVVETLASLSRFLLENETNHSVEWYEAEHSQFHQNRIETDEDTALLLNTLLSAERYSEECYALRCHNVLNENTREFPHIIYITGRLTDELTAFCDSRRSGERTTVLFCGKMDESQKKLADAVRALQIEVTEISPGTIQQSLSGLTI